MNHCLPSLNETRQDIRVQSYRLQPSTKVLSRTVRYYLSNIGGADVCHLNFAGDETDYLFRGIFAVANPHSLNFTDRF
jgi:hypothetical protein